MPAAVAPNIVIKQSNFNPVYLPLLKNKSRYLVLYGGSSSGKSHFAAQRYVARILNEKPMNLMVVRQVSKDHRDSTFALFKQVINAWQAGAYFKINEGDMRIKCLKNGNMIVFKGLDDVENLKSTTFENGEMTDSWIEEASQIAEDDFNQLDVRLRGGLSAKQIVISFNPISVTHWLKKKFFDKSNGSKQDTYIYSQKVIDGRSIKLYCTILHTTYKDNRFLGDAEKLLLESYKETDPYYYEVYCLGHWGVTGATVFDKQRVNARLMEIQYRAPARIGRFDYQTDAAERVIDSSIEFIDDSDGYVRIYEDVKTGYPYVVGGDTAGDGSDYFVNQVINNVTGTQVAKLRCQSMDEDLYAQQTYCLGIYFNIALIGPETNFSTYPIKELERLGYPNLYTREIEDNYTHKPMKSYGFQTNKKTRPQIIAMLVQEVRESPEHFNDVDTLNEMLVFIRNEKGRPEAAQGEHDDCIMSYGITLYIRSQQSCVVNLTPMAKRKKLIDILAPKNSEVIM
jgi:phage terminase large subunit